MPDQTFGAMLLRLKQQLGVQTNKSVAELLGMREKAFIARKSRNSFPETELYALAAKRPDLDLDVVYVLTGKPMQVRRPGGPLMDQSQASPGAASPQHLERWLANEEAGRRQDLLAAWIECGAEDQKALVRAAQGLAKKRAAEPNKVDQ